MKDDIAVAWVLGLMFGGCMAAAVTVYIWAFGKLVA